MKIEERREYYRAAANRWIEGVRLQAERCAGDRDNDLFFDSNFLVVAVARLIEVARMAQTKLQLTELSRAVEEFYEGHPEFRDVRDYQEHILDPSLIGSAMYFSGGVLRRLLANGRAETIVDPPRLLADAERLFRSLCECLGDLPPPKDSWVIHPPKKRRRPRP